MQPRSAWTTFKPTTCSSQDPATREGTALHYTGTVGSTLFKDHANCLAEVAMIERTHLADTAEGYCAIAYNVVVCWHGHVIEGRGVNIRSGANGTAEANLSHGSILLMLGTADAPNDAMKRAVLRAAKLVAPSHPHRFRPHSDYVATACPGDPTRAWIAAGAPAPGAAAALRRRLARRLAQARAARKALSAKIRSLVQRLKGH